ncbi:60S ribosomal protein L28 [Nymphon striatum]|nr:60S ribosomal protein L28 [Nymphon striatum]
MSAVFKFIQFHVVDLKTNSFLYLIHLIEDISKISKLYTISYTIIIFFFNFFFFFNFTLLHETHNGKYDFCFLQVTMSSSDLQWLLIRNTSCYMVRRRNMKKPFSKDPNNLKGVHSKKYDGLVNSKVLGISSATGNRGLTLTYKNKTNQRKPAKSLAKVTFNSGGRRSLQKIKNFIQHGRYRKDLKKVALKRASILLKSQRPVNLKKKGSRKKA